jgi:hypothetical protein
VSTTTRDDPRAIRAALYAYLSRHLSAHDHPPAAATLTRTLAPLSCVRIVGCLTGDPAATWRALRALGEAGA